MVVVNEAFSVYFCVSLDGEVEIDTWVYRPRRLYKPCLLLIFFSCQPSQCSTGNGVGASDCVLSAM